MLSSAPGHTRPALFVLAVLCLAPVASGADVYAFGAEELVGAAPHFAPLDIQVTGPASLSSFIGTSAMSLQGTFEAARGAHFVREDYAPGLLPYEGNPAHCSNQQALVDSLELESSYYCAEKTDFEVAAPGQLAVSFQPDEQHGNEEYGVRGYSLGDAHSVLGLIGELKMANVAQAYFQGGSTIQPIEYGDGADAPRDRENVPFFASHAANGPVVLLDTKASATFHVRGDLVLELMGPTVSIGGADYPTGPRSEGTGATSISEPDTLGFVRLILEGADLELRSTGVVHHQVAMVQANVATQHSSLALGGIRFMDDRIDVEGDTLPAPVAATMYPTTGSAMDGTVDTSANVGEAAAPFYNSDAAQTLFWIVGGILFMMAIVAVVFRQTSSPPLPRIEAALESGEYRKAARLSGRVLRRNPVQESAQLARAIAWSRMGAHDRIVRHLEPFLRRHDPSDGTLHYVYGLALHDAGDVASARAAMAEAVRRTPSLLPDVANELRPETSAEGYW